MEQWLIGCIAISFCFAAPKALVQAPPMTVNQLSESLRARPAGAEADALANKVRAWFGPDNLKKGPQPKVDRLAVAWAVEIPSSVSDRIVAVKSPERRIPLQRIGATDVYATVQPLANGRMKVDVRNVLTFSANS